MKHARRLGPIFFRAAAKNPVVRALLHTTIAMTQLEGSAADNVLPSAARAVINLRLLPPWTVDKAIARIKAVIADSRVSVSVHGLGTNPMEAGPGQTTRQSPGWKEIKAALAQVFPGAPALPFLMMATTDSRHFREMTQNIYRFSPQLFTAEEQSRIHGHDERISIENLESGLKFYTALMEQL
jgi:carboxypeptidase PM20D1